MYQDSGTPLSEARPWMTSAQAARIALVPPLVLITDGLDASMGLSPGLAEVIHACRARREPRRERRWLTLRCLLMAQSGPARWLAVTSATDPERTFVAVGPRDPHSLWPMRIAYGL